MRYCVMSMLDDSDENDFIMSIERVGHDHGEETNRQGISGPRR
jgi:hypothetical protein